MEKYQAKIQENDGQKGGYDFSSSSESEAENDPPNQEGGISQQNLMQPEIPSPKKMFQKDTFQEM